MSKIKLLAVGISIFTITEGLALGQKENDAGDTSGFALGAGLGTTDVASRFELQVRSPIIGEIDSQKPFGGEYSLILGAGTYTFRDVPVEDKTNLQWVMASYGAVGLRVELPSERGSHRYYGTYEAMYLSPGDDLSDKSGLWGGRAAMGLEFPVSPRENLFGKTLVPSLYVQGDIILGFERADKLAGKPDLFNGIGIWIGSRSYM